MYKIVDGVEVALTPEEIQEYNDLQVSGAAEALEQRKQYGRNRRDQLLKDTDFWALSDTADMTVDQITYRQALRDLPAQDGWPDNVTWPIKPE